MKVVWLLVGVLLGAGVMTLILPFGSPGASGVAASSHAALGEADVPEAVSSLGAKLSNPVANSEDYAAVGAAVAALQDLPDDRVRDLARSAFDGEAARRPCLNREIVKELLLREWVRRDAAAVLEWWLPIEGELPTLLNTIPGYRAIIARGVVAADPAVAAARVGELLGDRADQPLVPGAGIARDLFGSLLHDSEDEALKLWNALPIRSRQLLLQGVRIPDGVPHEILADRLGKGLDPVDAGLQRMIVRHWILEDGDAAFDWIGENLPLEDRAELCAMEPGWKGVDDGAERWKWMQRRFEACRIDPREHFKLLGGFVGPRSPLTLELYLATLEYRSQRDETYAAAAVGSVLRGMARPGIFFLSSIKTEATRQTTYQEMVRRALNPTDVKTLLFIIDDMNLSQAERDALLGVPGALPDSER